MGFTVYCGYYTKMRLSNKVHRLDHFTVSYSNFSVFRENLIRVLNEYLPSFKDIKTLKDYTDRVVEYYNNGESMPSRRIPNKRFQKILLASDIEGIFQYNTDSKELAYDFNEFFNDACRLMPTECVEQYVQWWKIFSFSTLNEFDVKYE